MDQTLTVYIVPPNVILKHRRKVLMPLCFIFFLISGKLNLVLRMLHDYKKLANDPTMDEKLTTVRP